MSKKMKRPQPYKYGGRTVPGMFKGNLPKAQFGWLDTIRDKAKDIGRKIVDSAPISKKDKKKTKSTIKNVANRINTFFGGDSDYWRKGGGLR